MKLHNWLDKFAKISIGIRLAILSATILLFTIGIFAYISITTQRQNAIELIHTNTTNLGHSFERMLRFSMQENQREEIDNSIKSLTKTKNIQTVTLTDHSGTIKYSIADSLLAQSLSLSHRICSSCHLSNNEILQKLSFEKQFSYNENSKKTWTIIPVYNAKNCSEASCHSHSSNNRILGVIDIVASTIDIETTLRRSHKKLLYYSLGIATVVFIILTFFYQRWISNPVKELIKGTKLVSLGKLDHTIPEGKAEFGVLATAFNRMQRKLKEIQQQLILTEKLISIGK